MKLFNTLTLGRHAIVTGRADEIGAMTNAQRFAAICEAVPDNSITPRFSRTCCLFRPAAAPQPLVSCGQLFLATSDSKEVIARIVGPLASSEKSFDLGLRCKAVSAIERTEENINEMQHAALRSREWQVAG